VERDRPEQIAAGRRELEQLLPWLDLEGMRWAGFRVDRAEPRQPGGRRPDRPFIESSDRISVAWPTKLAFAPALAAELLRELQGSGITPNAAAPLPIRWPSPPLAAPPWEEVEEWS